MPGILCICLSDRATLRHKISIESFNSCGIFYFCVVWISVRMNLQLENVRIHWIILQRWDLIMPVNGIVTPLKKGRKVFKVYYFFRIWGWNVNVNYYRPMVGWCLWWWYWLCCACKRKGRDCHGDEKSIHSLSRL